jgi:hypothetical protein
MKSEAEFKALIKKSVSAQKGYSMSLAAPMMAGTPDLYIVMPSYIPILLEAKFLGEIKRTKFSRTPQFTPMQINFLKSCHDVSPYSAMGVIGFIYEEKIHCSLVAYGTPCFYTFTSDFKTQTAWVTRSDSTKKLDILDLFAKVPIPKLEVPKQGLEDIIYGSEPTKIAVAI